MECTSAYSMHLTIPLQLFYQKKGKVFQKGERRIKRYECVETATGKVYLFQPNAEVELLT